MGILSSIISCCIVSSVIHSSRVMGLLILFILVSSSGSVCILSCWISGLCAMHRVFLS